MNKPETAPTNPIPETAAPAPAAAELPVETHTLTAEELEDLKQRASKADENWDRLLRQTADFENFKKRAARERQDAVKYAHEALLTKLLPVLDNFEMALAAAQNAPAEGVKSLQAGVTMIQQQLRATLTDAGLEEIEALGKPFDPHVHEAVSQLESADVPEGQVLQQLRRGYKLRDRLLRPASVIVAKAPPPDAPAAFRPVIVHHVQTRLLRNPRREPGRQRRRNQEGLPQARGQISPG
jgi:molecular chaperone GrpE